MKDAVCFACGYAVGVERFAVLIEGRLKGELMLCARHRAIAVDMLAGMVSSARGITPPV